MDASQLAQKVIEGNRRVLAKMITDCESTNPLHARRGWEVIEQLMELPIAQQRIDRAYRIVVAGSPGAGKSTLLEAMCLQLIADEECTPALLLVDPASPANQGAILGDQTRMGELSQTKAFIRPSANRPDPLCLAPHEAARETPHRNFFQGGQSSGLAPSGMASQMLCAAAGYHPIFTETVGVGQAETLVAEIADLLLVVIPADAGDELQGIKKGVIELADVLFVNKADGDLLAAARRTANEYRSARRMTHGIPHGKDEEAGDHLVLCGSAIAGKHVDSLLSLMTRLLDQWRDAGTLAGRRAAQREMWAIRTWHAAMGRALERDQAYVRARAGCLDDSGFVVPYKAEQAVEAYLRGLSTGDGASPGSADGTIG
ncbi:MAG: hypothetical protein K0U36_02415 [Alphaproteobacteria bacterium]|nr:hypothetical protein [Alphaproteobacteria bacterium]